MFGVAMNESSLRDAGYNQQKVERGFHGDT
jgi:hypothetical protein